MRARRRASALPTKNISEGNYLAGTPLAGHSLAQVVRYRQIRDRWVEAGSLSFRWHFFTKSVGTYIKNERCGIEPASAESAEIRSDNSAVLAH